MVSHLADREGTCSFLLQSKEAPTWARPFAAQDETCSALDLSEALTEVTNKRHRCYVIALTPSSSSPVPWNSDGPTDRWSNPLDEGKDRRSVSAGMDGSTTDDPSA